MLHDMKHDTPAAKSKTFRVIDTGRREFLGRASCAVFAAMAASGITADRMAAFPMAPVLAADPQGTERYYDVPGSDGVNIDKDNDVILIRYQNRIYAFALACPHENTALQWQPREQRFQCPRHKSKYQPNGAFISGRTTRNMDRFAVRLENGKVTVDLSKLYQSDRNTSEWESAVLVL